MQGRLQGCREDESATSREPECICRDVEKVNAALWPASVKEGGGRGKSFICVRRLEPF